MSKRTLGVIGGSGIYDLEELTDVKEVAVETPFGDPSDLYITGRLGDVEMVFLPRHGRGHGILPHEINYRANIFGMKKLGVEWLISLSAVGSMKENIHPGDMVIVDQYFDRTNGRISTFFGKGVAAHVSMAQPVSAPLADVLFQSASEILEGTENKAHKGGTYMVMNGPQFSSKAESLVYRTWGVDVIGMTNMPEAKLAREAEISYAAIALATDFDCWHEEEEAVTVEAVVAVVQKNAARARRVVQRAAALLPVNRNCIATKALENAIMTDFTTIPDATKKDLEPLIGKYISS